MTDIQMFQKQDYIYTPYFCEENIWQLCRSFLSQGVDKDQLDILFLHDCEQATGFSFPPYSVGTHTVL